MCAGSALDKAAKAIKVLAATMSTFEWSIQFSSGILPMYVDFDSDFLVFNPDISKSFQSTFESNF